MCVAIVKQVLDQVGVAEMVSLPDWSRGHRADPERLAVELDPPCLPGGGVRTEDHPGREWLGGTDDLDCLLERTCLAQDPLLHEWRDVHPSGAVGAGAIAGGGKLVQRDRDAGVVHATDAAGIDQARSAEGDVAVPAGMPIGFVDQEQCWGNVPVVQVGIQIAGMQMAPVKRSVPGRLNPVQAKPERWS